ncbi:MAG: sugar phosphate isomerase/epimerase family protein [Terriglobia bacterium]
MTRRNFMQSALALPASAAVWRASAGPERQLPFRLGVITDEISEDLDQALDFLASYKLNYCELREIGNKNIMNLSKEQLTRARDLIRKRGFHVSDIASPLFKYNLPEMPAQPNEKRDTFSASFTHQDTDDLLRRAFEIARLFGTNKIRIFSYWRVDEPEKAFPHVRTRLARAAAMAGKEKMLLVLENEPACNVGTGKELGRILREVNSPHLRGVWDPGNVTMLGEVPYPDGYREVRGMFNHMHVKDAKKDPTTGKLAWVPVGDGMVDFRGQFKALREDKYVGTMSLETHYRRPDGNRMESTRESLLGLLKLLRELE